MNLVPQSQTRGSDRTVYNYHRSEPDINLGFQQKQLQLHRHPIVFQQQSRGLSNVLPHNEPCIPETTTMNIALTRTMKTMTTIRTTTTVKTTIIVTYCDDYDDELDDNYDTDGGLQHWWRTTTLMADYNTDDVYDNDDGLRY